MKIFEADDRHVPALHALVERAYRGDTARTGWTHEADLLGGQRTDQEALQDMIGDQGQVILLAEIDGRLAGCVQLSRLDQKTSYLGMLTVDPEIQAQGTGKRIIIAAEKFVQDKWASSAMEMSVIKQRKELISYYERRGYALTGEKRPFPSHDPRFGLPKSDDLEFAVLRKEL